MIAEAKDKEIRTSLAVFKPTKVLNFIYKKEPEREWSKKKLAQFEQHNLFYKADDKKFEIVKKLPYKFSFKFEDDEGKRSTTMIEDWETGELFWNCLRKFDGDEQKACEAVKQKYFNDFAKTKDLYFFLGTTQRHHYTAPNPFIIIGTFHPKHITQLDLF